MATYREILQSEFSAEDGSFLLLLHVWNYWNREAFTKVITAMQECCEDQEGQETMERWLANGFWLIYGEITSYKTKCNFRPVYSPEYYEKAIARVFDLACWYFSGVCPFLPGTILDPI